KYTPEARWPSFHKGKEQQWQQAESSYSTIRSHTTFWSPRSRHDSPMRGPTAHHAWSIWFQRAGNEIVLCTFYGAPKLRALHSGDRVALTIDTNSPPNHILAIRGTVQVTHRCGVIPEYAQAAERYLGREQAHAYIGSLPPDV